jgi:hypothetical protein
MGTVLRGIVCGIATPCMVFVDGHGIAGGGEPTATDGIDMLYGIAAIAHGSMMYILP